MLIACWSGPRNISTALMRSWSSRKDTFVSDEPFYAYYLKKNRIKHPLSEQIINLYPNSYDLIVKSITSTVPKNKKIWYQKHMAHHIDESSNLSWTKEMNNAILLRHPSLVIDSFSKKSKLNDSRQLGYEQQFKIYKYLKSQNKDVFIINTEIFLDAPELYLRNWCRFLKIQFDKSMLNWDKNFNKYDGLWGKHWYKNVNNSTGFKKNKIKAKKISDKYSTIYDESMIFYNKLVNLTK